MVKLRLIAKVWNVLPFRTAKPQMQRRFTFGTLEELAERDDFGEILTSAGVPDRAISERPRRKWSGGEEFDASTFGNAAYRKYQKGFFEK